MKVLTIIATIIGTSMAAGAWERCSNNADCGALTCCDVINDGQTPTRLCGSGVVVPAGSVATAYDGGQVRCRPKPVEATTGAFSIGVSSAVAVGTTAAYLMAWMLWLHWFSLSKIEKEFLRLIMQIIIVRIEQQQNN